AHDAAVFALVGQVVDVPAVLPLGHPPVMVSPGQTVTHAVRVADIKAAYPLFATEIDHLSRAFVAQIAHLAFHPGADFGAGALEFPPAPGAFLAPRPLPGDLTQRFVQPALDRPDPAPGDDQRRARVRGDR